MGLDMWVHSVERPSMLVVGKFETTNDVYAAPGYNYILAEDMLSEPEMYQDLTPFTIKTILKTEVFNEDRFKKANNIPTDYICTGGHYGYNETNWTYMSKRSNPTKNIIEISCSKDDYPKYLDYPAKECYIFRYDELTYWRKNYNTQDNIYNIYNKYSKQNIQNCGWHRLTQEMVKELNKIDKEFAKERFGIIASVDDENSGLFYHEWY